MQKRMMLFIVSLLLAGLVGCGIGGSPDDMKDVRKMTKEGIVYELFYIEGMPCVRVGRSDGDGVWGYDGVTCDWSKWGKGNR